jgi:hypothetical protein
MRTRVRLGIAIAAVAVFAVAAIASAEGLLSLSASPLKVTYPHRSTLTVTFPTTDPATATILAMPVGASEWTTTTLKATTATPTVSVKPKVTTAYKACLSDELMSEPVTVSVAAKLSRPQIGSNIRKNHTYRIKGTMQPGEKEASVTVTFYRMETVSTTVVIHGVGHVRRSDKWVKHSSVEVGLTYRNSQTSSWTTKWTPREKGWWKVVVSHEDAAHVASSATTYKWVR